MNPLTVLYNYISLILVCILCTDLTFQSDCHNNVYTNGCSIPFRAPFPFSKTAFLPACDIHDLCYKCGTMYGKTRKDCDVDFHNNLKEICGSSWRLKLQGCAVFVKIYYGAVRVGGFNRFKEPAYPGCDESWVKPCL